MITQPEAVIELARRRAPGGQEYESLLLGELPWGEPGEWLWFLVDLVFTAAEGKTVFFARSHRDGEVEDLARAAGVAGRLEPDANRLVHITREPWFVGKRRSESGGAFHANEGDTLCVFWTNEWCRYDEPRDVLCHVEPMHDPPGMLKTVTACLHGKWPEGAMDKTLVLLACHGTDTIELIWAEKRSRVVEVLERLIAKHGVNARIQSDGA